MTFIYTHRQSLAKCLRRNSNTFKLFILMANEATAAEAHISRR